MLGVGLTTASMVLAKIHESDREFFNDLSDSKLKFTGRWNDAATGLSYLYRRF